MQPSIPSLSLGLGLTLALAACQGSGSFAKLQESLGEISAKQDTLASKLDALEAKVGSAPAKPGDRGLKAGQPDPNVTYRVDVGDAHTKGSPAAKVTIVEWSDFQCPFCSRVVPTLHELSALYGDKLRVAFKHNALPMHNRARAAAIAAEAAGRQGKFWEMHDKMFEHSKELTDENFVTWAGGLGLDAEKFKKDLADPALAKKVDDNQKQGTTLGARGTPAFFVNGRYLSGAQPVDAFKAVIDEEIKKADALIAKGVSADRVYEETIKNGKAAP